MKRILLLLILITFIWSAVSFGYRNEPDGFRGIRWYTSVDSVSSLVYLGRNSDYDDIAIYRRIGDPGAIGEAKLTKINYWFWKGEFFAGLIYCDGKINFDRLLNSLLLKFGVPYKPYSYKDKYWWNDGTVTQISANYDPVYDEGVITFRSKDLYYAIEREQQRKAAKGADEGF